MTINARTTAVNGFECGWILFVIEYLPPTGDAE
jgi:hypothetical protein